MSFLKKENWPISLILTICLQNFYSFVLAYALKLYDKNAWYYKWYYWFLGTICLVFPSLIMLLVFSIQIMVLVADKLNVPGREIYAIPYTWILCIIIPVVGWVLLIVMIIYLLVWPVVMLYRGEGEKYIEK